MIIKWPWSRNQIEAVRPDMTRRRFLVAMAAVPVAAALAPELVDLLKPPKMISLPPRMAMSGYLTDPHAWYLKTEGGAIPMYKRSGLMSRAAYCKQLQAVLNEVFSREYDQHPGDWRGIFGNPPPDVPLDGVIAYDHIPRDEYMQTYNHQAHALGFKIVRDGPDEDLTDYEALSQKRYEALVASTNQTADEAMSRYLTGDHSYNQVTTATEQLIRGADGLVRSVDRAVDTVNALPAAAEDLARDVATSPIDLVKRILRS